MDFLITDTNGNVTAGDNSIAQRLLACGFRTNALRTNAVLRADQWKQFDTELVREAVRPMRALGYLRQAGLVKTLTNGFGTMVFQWDQAGDLDEAEMSMDAESQRGNSAMLFTPKYLPLPIIHHSWFLNGRVLAASKRDDTQMGADPLDTEQAGVSGRKIGEYAERLLLLGSGAFKFGDSTSIIYGLTDHPDRNLYEMATDWASASGAAIVDDVIGMMAAAQADLFFGPYTLFVSGNCAAHWSDDYDSNYPKTIVSRVREIEGLQAVVFCPFLNYSSSASQGILFQTTPDVVRVVEGMPLQNVQWEEKGTTRFHFKGMTIQVPQVRSTKSGKSGVVHCAAGLT